MLLALSLASACAPAVRANDPSAPATDRTVRLSTRDFGHIVTLHVGDVLVVPRPGNFDEWDLAFSTEVLRSLNTEDGRRRPPADGWTFAVVGAGTTDVSFTPFAAGGGAVPRFVVTVTAR
jgi:hypothetical protein